MNSLHDKYIGKHLLVGLTYLNTDESVQDRIQIHGKIVDSSESTIVFIREDNGEEFSIPFDEDNLEKSDPDSVYHLKSTGETVENVDFVSSWTIHPPKK